MDVAHSYMLLAASGAALQSICPPLATPETAPSIVTVNVVARFAVGLFINAPLATAIAPLCIGSVHLFVRLFVRLSVCRQNAYTKNAILSKVSNLEAESYGFY